MQDLIHKARAGALQISDIEAVKEIPQARLRENLGGIADGISAGEAALSTWHDPAQSAYLEPQGEGSDRNPDWKRAIGLPCDYVYPAGDSFKGFVNEEYGRLLELLAGLTDGLALPQVTRDWLTDMKTNLERVKAAKDLQWGTGGEFHGPITPGENTLAFTGKRRDGTSQVFINWQMFHGFLDYVPCGYDYWRLFSTIVNELDSVVRNRAAKPGEAADETQSSMTAISTMRVLSNAMRRVAESDAEPSSSGNRAFKEWLARRKCLDNIGDALNNVEKAVADEMNAMVTEGTKK